MAALREEYQRVVRRHRPRPSRPALIPLDLPEAARLDVVDALRREWEREMRDQIGREVDAAIRAVAAARHVDWWNLNADDVSASALPSPYVVMPASGTTTAGDFMGCRIYTSDYLPNNTAVLIAPQYWQMTPVRGAGCIRLGPVDWQVVTDTAYTTYDPYAPSPNFFPVPSAPLPSAPLPMDLWQSLPDPMEPVPGPPMPPGAPLPMPAPPRNSFIEAKERAEALLRRFLTPAQREQFDRADHFDVVGSLGGRYRIRYGTAGNIYRLDERGEWDEQWCVHPPDVPPGDAMLAQMVMLQHDEAHVRALANITTRDGRYFAATPRF